MTTTIHIRNRVLSHVFTAAILVSQNNETAAMLESQTRPTGVELFNYANVSFCSNCVKTLSTPLAHFPQCTLFAAHPPPTPQFLHNHCISFLLGITAVPREIEKQCLCKMFGGKIRCIMGDVQVAY